MSRKHKRNERRKARDTKHGVIPRKRKPATGKDQGGQNMLFKDHQRRGGQDEF